ncbi:MAG: alpha/beta fold hydrolase [Candidatus Sulfotelmatobacter sp.]
MIAQNSTIRSLFLEGPAGRLEALLNAGAENATHAAVVCHPHPLFGGTLHNKVVFHTMKALNSFGFPVLRFNFRGAGLSHGEHDHGEGEVEDVRAALDWLDSEFHLPMVFAGFSFGAAVGLRAACPDPRVRALIGIGTPVVPVAADTEALRQRRARPVRSSGKTRSPDRISAAAKEAGPDRRRRSFLRRPFTRAAGSD